MSESAVSISLEDNLELFEFIKKFGVNSLSNSEYKERMRHRMTFRNERHLYKRKSSMSGKDIISIYAPNSRHSVFSPEEWWGDSWDGENFGRPVDFNRPFFEQFRELQLQVPRISLFNVNPYNSNYCQQAYGNKNCYLCTVVKDCEDSQYVSHANNLKDCYDCDYVQHSELCYDCLDGDKLYSCIGCDQCYSSNNLWFCFDCIGSSDSIGCWGLRNEKYKIFNVQYSKDEFEQMKRAFNLSSRVEYLKWKSEAVAEAREKHSRRDFLVSTEESTGNNLRQTKKAFNCFDSYQLEEAFNCTWGFESHHCAEIYGMGTSEWVYECVGIEKLNFGAFNTFVSDSNNAFYSDICFYSTNIFGCVGLRRKRNAILNKVYTEDEFEILRETLKDHMKKTGEWGKFFPAYCSPFAYNETVAYERFPMNQQEVASLGYDWRNPDIKDYLPSKVVIEDSIKGVDESIILEALSCKSTKKNYKITPQELSFYKKQSLPVPDICPDERYALRLSRRFPFERCVLKNREF